MPHAIFELLNDGMGNDSDTAAETEMEWTILGRPQTIDDLLESLEAA